MKYHILNLEITEIEMTKKQIDEGYVPQTVKKVTSLKSHRQSQRAIQNLKEDMSQQVQVIILRTIHRHQVMNNRITIASS